MTPERAAEVLAETEADRRARDPEPAHLRQPELVRPLPWYMPPGAPRPMAVRETVRALGGLGGHVPLWLQLLAADPARRVGLLSVLGSAWSRPRAVLAALGVLGWLADHAPPVADELRAACWIGVPGPPGLAAVTRSLARIAAGRTGAFVT